jgi:DNA-binding response OmpR family regulator
MLSKNRNDLSVPNPGLRGGSAAGGEKGLDLDTLYDRQGRQRILIIDDDPDTIMLLKEILRAEGFDVYGARSCDEALSKAGEFPPQLILLDLMMPDHDGWDTFGYLRELTNAPVIVVSAKDTKDEIVKGLQIGIEDYIVKPFFNAEVVARVRNILRRAPVPENQRRFIFPDVNLVIDMDGQEVKLDGAAVHVTPREFAVLSVLARHAPRNTSNETIAEEVWGQDSPLARKRIKYIIYLIRKKLEKDPSAPVLIVNNEAYGYSLQVTRPHLP